LNTILNSKIYRRKNIPFPKSNRVIYKKNPLEKVICQLRFPPILKIDKEIPFLSEFQEQIREEFPNYEKLEEPNIPLSSVARGSLPSDINMFFSSNINYAFFSEDDLWSVNLTRTYLALTTKKYEKWEEFRKKLQGPLNALKDIYKPSFFSRIGLRYIDVIKRKKLGLEQFNWNELLKSYVLGLVNSEVGDRVQSLKSTYLVRLGSDNSKAKIRVELEKETEDNENIFKIDTDFFLVQKTDVNKTGEILDKFHILGGRLIRWIITNKLHKAMIPQKP